MEASPTTIAPCPKCGSAFHREAYAGIKPPHATWLCGSIHDDGGGFSQSLRCKELSARTPSPPPTLDPLAAEAVELLRQLEWARPWRNPDIHRSHRRCPSCWLGEDVGHAPGCKLASILKQADALRGGEGG